MLSDACLDFIDRQDTKEFVSEVHRYLNNELFGAYYTGEIRVHAQWILDNPSTIHLLLKEAQFLFSELSKP